MKKTYTLPNDLVFELERLSKQFQCTRSSIIITALLSYLYHYKTSPDSVLLVLNQVKQDNESALKVLTKMGD